MVSMDTQLHLAIDIGASGGRHILGWLENGTLRMEEVHRFPNGTVQADGHLCWDTDAIFAEIIAGLKKCAIIGKIPATVGIDTWGVDFVLLDSEGNRAGPAIAYRDSRTAGMDAEVYKRVPEAELYARTGIQKQLFNTIFQLMALKTKMPAYLSGAAHLLMMPDYLHFRLCGAMKAEYTNATTTGLVNAATKEWDEEIIGRCGFPRALFGAIAPAGTALGRLTDEVRQAVGFDCMVALPPTHDTASAFLAVPARTDDSVYISSGTWSLMGVERLAPIISEAGRLANFTNEGGYAYRFRYLKNIMGLWMIQSVCREMGGRAGFAELEALARASEYSGEIDVNAECFFAPDSMAAAIRQACRRSGQDAPEGPGDLARCIYQSLTSSYAQTIKELEAITGKRFGCVNIIGGGSRDGLLNELTAKACGLPVYAGPVEATALGNIVSQMIGSGELSGVKAAREAIMRGFEIQEIIQ